MVRSEIVKYSFKKRFTMTTAFTIGKRQLKSDDVLPLLSGHSLWPQLMQGIVIDKVLRTMICSREEVDSHYRRELENDADFLNKKREQLLLEGAEENDVEFFVNRPVLLEKFKLQKFSPQVESTFLKMKSGLDKVTFLMLRNRDHELLRELYFRIDSGEESFESLAARHSEGRESVSGGKIGPLEMKKMNPALASSISSAKPGVVNPPVVIDGFGVITMLKEKTPAHLDENMKKQIINQLFSDWVNGEVQAFFY
jgi:hypothetical protein